MLAPSENDLGLGVIEVLEPVQVISFVHLPLPQLSYMFIETFMSEIS